MCMIDDSERCDVWNAAQKVARKPHICTECRRQISPRESYTNIRALYDGHWSTYKQCSHCRVATDWLWQECGGYLSEGVQEDINEHAQGYQKLSLWRLAFGMARQWKRFDGNGLMPVQKMPPLSHAQGSP